jgi:hypothetical protein
MESFIVYLIGWLILSVCYYVYTVRIEKSWKSKKLIVWRSFWTGIFSWGGIFFIGVFLLVGGILAINEWIEDKLS